ncbi:zinc finger protein 664 isoform X3 [Enhydra lutris kenyoni]|uniref:Zinc finger protein 664 isoform X3 n=1 Tax=Enhydra lutris kenyoni TaxID=391180 RepID=A0A2Y9KI31_ENHLU|nr:zinc finger protein 664 isoform X3 [Enhydra lutris kenyoni]
MVGQPLGWPLLPLGLAWVRGADGPQPGLEPWQRHPFPITGWKTLQAAGAGSLRLTSALLSTFSCLSPATAVSSRGHPSPPPSPGGETRGPPPAAERAFKTALNKFLSRQVPPPPLAPAELPQRYGQSALRPSRARRASYSGDEEPFAHPAQNAAAAGRLHCLTTTRAGFSPRFGHGASCIFLSLSG